ncbi:hypothetical protein RN001_015504 [Aquatica leii]|uniref:Uncharacterized protein n=1 Tax=Aquatica leii TaxID=1421715 RepID=A0AAN7NVQ2_9COLE|nr:hypothetical protein RN001_015504 [Aquatica leii]
MCEESFNKVNNCFLLCESGVPYIENECNKCVCVKGGLGYTAMACMGGVHDELKDCEVGTMFKRGGNDCWCVKNKGASFGFECEKNVPYKENDCNSCSCLDSGIACTDMACGHQKSIDMLNCEVGTTSKNDCNDCWCVHQIGTICTDYPC